MIENIQERFILESVVNERHYRAFKDYLVSSIFQARSLDLPASALDAFIPPKVLEISKNPLNVCVLVEAKTTGKLSFEIVEQAESLPQGQAKNGGNISGKNKIGFSGGNFISRVVLTKPEIPTSRAVKVSNYLDNPKFRNQGISMDFFNNLNKLLKDLGFDYVFGVNNSNNVKYFLNKLGRKSLIKHPELWKEFGYSLADDPFVTFSDLRL